MSPMCISVPPPNLQRNNVSPCPSTHSQRGGFKHRLECPHRLRETTWMWLPSPSPLFATMIRLVRCRDKTCCVGAPVMMLTSSGPLPRRPRRQPRMSISLQLVWGTGAGSLPYRAACPLWRTSDQELNRCNVAPTRAGQALQDGIS